MVVDLYKCDVVFEYHLHKLQDSRSSLPSLTIRHQLFLCERDKEMQSTETVYKISVAIKAAKYEIATFFFVACEVVC